MHDLMPCPPRWVCSVLSVQVLSQLQARTARGDEASASPIQDRPAGCDAVSGRARQADSGGGRWITQPAEPIQRRTRRNEPDITSLLAAITKPSLAFSTFDEKHNGHHGSPLPGQAAAQDPRQGYQVVCKGGELPDMLRQLTVQSLAYGQCIGKQYQDVRKDMCAPEFAQFKNCVQVSFLGPSCWLTSRKPSGESGRRSDFSPVALYDHQHPLFRIAFKAPTRCHYPCII